MTATPTLWLSKQSMSEQSRVSTCMLLAALSLVPIDTAFAADNSAQCPKELKSQQVLRSTHKGWTFFNENTNYPMVSIRFSEGEPSDMVWLAPTNLTDPSIQHWFFPKSKRGYWIACGYGSTSIVLALRLPPETVKCTVWFDKDYLPPIAIKYNCQ